MTWPCDISPLNHNRTSPGSALPRWPPDGDPVMQTQIYYADTGRGYTATATTTVRNGGMYEDLLLKLLQALVIDKAVSTVG